MTLKKRTSSDQKSNRINFFCYFRVIGSTQYKWKNNGDVELIPEIFSNGKETSIARSVDEENDDDIVYLPQLEQALDETEENMSTEQSASLPEKNKLTLQVK